MQPQFIEVSGVVINIAQISFIDFRQEGAANIHVGGSSIGCSGEEAEKLRRFFMPTVQSQTALYPCGCSATGTGPDKLPGYCPEHGAQPAGLIPE